MQRLLWLLVVAVLGVSVAEEHTHRHHHKRHHHHHKPGHRHRHHHHHHRNGSAHEGTNSTNSSATVIAATGGNLAIKSLRTAAVERQQVSKTKDVEGKLVIKEAIKKDDVEKTLEVNGPLPTDFAEMFSRAVAQATNTDPHKVRFLKVLSENNGIVKILFKASSQVADATLNQAADPDSKLVNGPLHNFLVLNGDVGSDEEPKAVEGEEQSDGGGNKEGSSPGTNPIDVDTAMPFGQLEPFGREDTAQELTEQSISESNEMVDELERAQVAEEKRAVFRALTRLRGAAIAAFDGIARSQTAQIDEYAKKNQWRAQHPVRHLAQEESDISKWAFPDF